MIKKYKTEIIIFLVSFLFYYVIGTVLSYYLDTAKYLSVLFDLDTVRVLGDLSIRDFNHYRVAVHPLFVISFQPIVFMLKIMFRDPVITIIFIQGVISSISTLLIYKILGKMDLKKYNQLFFTILFGISFTQILYSATIETYIYAQFLLIPLWLFVLCKLDKKLIYWDYIILALLGIASIAVTVTNFMQFIIAIIFLIILNKKTEKRFISACVLIIIVIAMTVFLAEVQNIIWPSAPNFFSKGINDYLSGTFEEVLYTTKTLGLRNFLNVLNANFSYPLSLPNLYIQENVYLKYQDSGFSNWFSILAGFGFAVMNIFFMIKTRLNISKHKFYYALLTVCAFNIVLHLFYGNQIAFLYVAHYNFTIIIILAYIINYFKINLFKYKYLFYVMILTLVALSAKNIISMFNILAPIYNPIEKFSVFPIITVGVALSLLICVIIKNNYVRLAGIFVLFISLCAIWNCLNYRTDYCSQKYEESNKYCESLNIYINQLEDMKNEFNVHYYSNRDEPVGIYYFGMANRTKILYKEGKLINIKTKAILKSINVESELIVPNEYTVLLKDKHGNNYKIFENKKGIYFSKNGNVETIFEGNQNLNLPEFEENKYSEILKVSHQEVLFNIDGDVPKPNLITYSGAWYRDSMLATMVLEETNNTNLLKNWVNSIDSIYDFQRSSTLKEADNLGELLYIIGAVGVKRNDLIEEIKAEIKNITQPDGSIKGIVDGRERSLFPTVVALYGAKKAGIKLNLTIPEKDDEYGKLTWYYDNSKNYEMQMKSRPYPYLDWAFYHYDKSGELYILDEIYPLSYEGGSDVGSGPVYEECFVSEYYCGQSLSLSHIWHASEMFLFLKEF